MIEAVEEVDVEALVGRPEVEEVHQEVDVVLQEVVEEVESQVSEVVPKSSLYVPSRHATRHFIYIYRAAC